jgi:uncharacterized protein YneR
MELLNFLNLKIESKRYLDSIKKFGNEKIVKADDDPDIYYIYKEGGISFVSNKKNIVGAIQIYSEGKDDYTKYSGEIPNDIKFDFSRKSVMEKLGEPNRSDGDYEDKQLGYIAAWDSYYFDDYTMHISYKKGTESIDMITIMTPEATPGR